MHLCNGWVIRPRTLVIVSATITRSQTKPNVNQGEPTQENAPHTSLSAESSAGTRILSHPFWVSPSHTDRRISFRTNLDETPV